MIPRLQTLVKYENPHLISRYIDDKSAKSTSETPAPGTSSPGPKSKPSSADHDKKDYEDVLDMLLPPRRYEADGKLWIQKVSRTSATRNDILNLQEQLDHQLQQKEARELGLCPIRRELYDQLFDELMRQETIACPERGILLKRIRDDARTTLAAYQTLYESSVAFGVRKTLRSEKVKMDLKKKLEDMLAEKEKVNQSYEELKANLEETEARLREEQEQLKKENEEEEDLLIQANQQLKTQLEAIIAP